jgi:hypothetical protein
VEHEWDIGVVGGRRRTFRSHRVTTKSTILDCFASFAAALAISAARRDVDSGPRKLCDRNRTDIDPITVEVIANPAARKLKWLAPAFLSDLTWVRHRWRGSHGQSLRRPIAIGGQLLRDRRGGPYQAYQRAWVIGDIMANRSNRRSGEPEGLTRLERDELIGTRSADVIRASSHEHRVNRPGR